MIKAIRDRLVNANLSQGYCILCLVLAALLQSRSFFIGGMVASCCSFFYFGNPKKRVALSIITLLCTVPLLALVFKTDSTKGRLLIYKISGRILKDHYMNGIGLGNFQLKYSDYQLDYFKRGNFTEKELLLADTTIYAFNDYLQLLIETGVKGGGILLFFILFLWYIIYQSENRTISETRKVCLINMVILSVAALFTHVFYHKPFLSIFVLSLAGFISHYLYKSFPLINRFLLAAAILFIVYQYSPVVKNYRNYKSFESAKQLFHAGFIDDAYIQTRRLVASLQADVDFLFIYSDILVARGELKDALAVLQKLERKKRTNMVYTRLAKIYLLIGDFKKSEMYYLKAIYVVPNRFNTRHNLFNFYLQRRQLVDAKKVGADILMLPVKVPSYEVNYIKKDVIAKLRAYQTKSF